ncbi:MAG: esterase/lipase family protein [Candidatus Nitrosocosmicus sp.]
MDRSLVLTLTLCLPVLLLLSHSNLVMSNNSYAQLTKSATAISGLPLPPPPPPTISTRGQFNMLTGHLNPGVGTTSYTLTGPPFPGLHNNIACPDTAIIFVHGMFTPRQGAMDDFSGFAPALSSKGFLSLFSWDSDTNTNTSAANIIRSVHTAETIGDQNGMKLAQFILDYGTACPQMKIRLVGHSMGNLVILQALNILNQVRIVYPDVWHKLLTSVDLLGAFVPVSSVRPGGEFYDGLKMAADIHSYYSSLDSVMYLLEFADNLPNINPALGHTDAHVISIYSINVAPMIGANHEGYLSPRSMNLVTTHWDHRKLFGSTNFGPVLSSFCYPAIQDCTEGKSFLLDIKNSSSLCNPAFSKCSSDEITRANTNYIKNRNNLTSLIESTIKPIELTQLSNIAMTLEDNSTASKNFVTIITDLKSRLK